MSLLGQFETVKRDRQLVLEVFAELPEAAVRHGRWHGGSGSSGSLHADGRGVEHGSHGNRGEIRKAYRQEQEEQLGALGLTLNAIALWNATYIQAALDQLTREERDISRPDVARISPLAFKHINFLGRYAFDLPEAVAEGALRPLRNPNSE